MDTKTIIEEFKRKFSNEILEEVIRNERRVIITIKPESILKLRITFIRQQVSDLLLQLQSIQKGDLRSIIISARIL